MSEETMREPDDDPTISEQLEDIAYRLGDSNLGARLYDLAEVVSSDYCLLDTYAERIKTLEAELAEWKPKHAHAVRKHHPPEGEG